MGGYSQPSALFHDDIGVFNETIQLIRTPEMGAAVAAALGRRRAVLLKNHGIAVVGASIEEAVISALMLEHAAEIQLIVEATGLPAQEFSPEDLASLKESIAAPEQFVVNFNYVARRLASGPSLARVSIRRTSFAH